MAKASEFLISDQHCTQMNLNYNTSCIIFIVLLTRKKQHNFTQEQLVIEMSYRFFQKHFHGVNFSNVRDSNPISLK